MFLANTNFVLGNIDVRFSTGRDLSSDEQIYFTSNGTVGRVGLVYASCAPLCYNTGEFQTSDDLKARLKYTIT